MRSGGASSAPGPREAAFYRHVLEGAGVDPLETVLELGSGGGNNASHLKRRFRLTLVDASPDMLAVSRALNPECEHVQGDMRSVRLEREFDAVFVHDAIAYMTSRDDLLRAMRTARAHCRAGGVALFAPDHVLETFVPRTSHAATTATGARSGTSSGSGTRIPPTRPCSPTTHIC